MLDLPKLFQNLIPISRVYFRPMKKGVATPIYPAQSLIRLITGIEY